MQPWSKSTSNSRRGGHEDRRADVQLFGIYGKCDVNGCFFVLFFATVTTHVCFQSLSSSWDVVWGWSWRVIESKCEIRLGKLVWECAAETSGPVWHWADLRAALSEHAMWKKTKTPPIPVCLDACTVKSRTVGHNEHMYYSNSRGAVTQSLMSKLTQPSVCFMREKKLYLNWMTHRVKRTLYN